MDWTAKLDQQHDALMRVFYMLIFAVLMVIRTGLDVRNVPASYSFTPYDNAPQDDENLSLMQFDRLDQLYAEAMVLLSAAHAVARRLASMGREIYELMKQAFGLAHSLQDQVPPDRAHPPARHYGQAGAPFDTS